MYFDYFAGFKNRTHLLQILFLGLLYLRSVVQVEAGSNVCIQSVHKIRTIFYRIGQLINTVEIAFDDFKLVKVASEAKSQILQLEVVGRLWQDRSHFVFPFLRL